MTNSITNDSNLFGQRRANTRGELIDDRKDLTFPEWYSQHEMDREIMVVRVTQRHSSPHPTHHSTRIDGYFAESHFMPHHVNQYAVAEHYR